MSSSTTSEAHDARLPTATENDEAAAAPLGEVLGPLTVWMVTAILAALVGESLGDRLLQHVEVAAGRTVPVVLGASAALLAAAGGWAARRDAAAGSRAAAASPRTYLGVLGIAMVVLVVVPASVVRVLSADVGLLPQLAQQGGARQIDAMVVHEPRPIASGWHVLLRVTAVEGTRTRERAAVTLDADVDPPTLGSRWEVEATARPLPDGGYGRWLARQHASVVLDVRRWEPSGPPGWLAAVSEHVRERIRAAATHHLADRTGGLLVGFVSGDTRLLPEDDQAAMQATSLTHLTAVSGANVAIVVGGVLLFLGMVRVGARWRRRIIAVTIVAFAFLTRFEPSVLRAGSMALLVLVVGARGMPRDTRHVLSGAVLILILLDPRLAGSLGLLLSATATAGVLMVAPLVAQRLHRFPRRLRQMAAISIGAQIAVVPLLLTTFGEVSLASVPANIVAVPAAAVAAVLSFLGSLFAIVHVEFGAPLFWLAGGPAHVVLAAAHGFDGVGGIVEVARPITVAALLAGSGWVLTERGTRPARCFATVAVAGTLVSASPQLGGLLPQRHMTVTAIDVGQGDAFLIETPGARILVDAGGDAAAARWLRRHGRRHLDLVVVTHPHLDHVGGVPEVLRRIRVDAVWYRLLPTELPEDAEVVTAAHERGVPIRDPAVGERVSIGDTLVEVVHPPPGRPYRWSGSELNDTSIVVRVTHGDRRVLVTGDIELAAQGSLLAEDQDVLSAELLTVPHHGAATTDPDFVVAVAPAVALVSVGQDNRHGHPHPEIVALLEQLGVEVRRTDHEGTVRVRVPARHAATARSSSSGGRRRLGSAPDPPRASGRREPGSVEPGRGIHGVLDVPQDGDTDLRPAAVLAGCRRGDRNRHLHDDDGGRAGSRARRPDPRAASGPDLRRAVDRAVPHPLGVERVGEGEQGRRGVEPVRRRGAGLAAIGSPARHRVRPAGVRSADPAAGSPADAAEVRPAAGVRAAGTAAERSAFHAVRPTPGTATVGSTVGVAPASGHRARHSPTVGCRHGPRPAPRR